MLSSEVLCHHSAVFEDDPRVDIWAAGFWPCSHHKTFFNVCVFNSFAATNRSSTLAATFHQYKGEKSRAYEERICEIEHGSFTPLFFPVLVVWVQLLP